MSKGFSSGDAGVGDGSGSFFGCSDSGAFGGGGGWKGPALSGPEVSRFANSLLILIFSI